ncbi:hypothetical protein SORBI_3002G191800 [Sorghum bicolor]|uniref:Secreted protein n=1 Tax=Sorghum bicolor TaxID=4558 RepID=A0A1B6QCD5_SORBI|nr:hypothetical protein SORBI_3002G191800 [Sorghum bicolor]OQU89448.1 hypothetical protein SORBI_3002G191800 [Sorghum bicolor]
MNSVWTLLVWMPVPPCSLTMSAMSSRLCPVFFACAHAPVHPGPSPSPLYLGSSLQSHFPSPKSSSYGHGGALCDAWWLAKCQRAVRPSGKENGSFLNYNFCHLVVHMWRLQLDSTCEGLGFGIAVADPMAAGDSVQTRQINCPHSSAIMQI